MARRAEPHTVMHAWGRGRNGISPLSRGADSRTRLPNRAVPYCPSCMRSTFPRQYCARPWATLFPGSATKAWL